MPDLPEELRTEFASAHADPKIHYGGDVLMPHSDPVLEREAGGELARYRDLERDTQVTSILDKRKGLVLSAEYEVEPASEAKWDVYAADVVREQLANLGWEDKSDDLLDAELLGYAVAETIWVPDGRIPVAADLRPKAPERFVRGKGGEIRMLTKEAPVRGIEVPARKFVWHSWGGKYGDPYGRGLGYVWFYPVLFKRRGLSSWLQYAEKFGGPTTITEYDAMAPNAEELRRKGVELGLAIHQDTAVSIPKGLEARFLEAARTGSIDTYDRLVAYMDKHIALSGLGVTSTSDLGDRGARSAVESHQDEQTRLFGKRDARQLAATAKEQLVEPITYFATGGKGECPRLKYLFPQLEDLDGRAERDGKVYALGYEPSEAYINETYEGEWTKRSALSTPPPAAPDPQPPGAPGAGGDDPAFAEPKRSPDPSAPDPSAELFDQVADAEAAAAELMLRPLRQLVDRATSLTQIRDGVAALFGEMSSDETAEVLWQAMALAEARGRADILDEIS